MSYLRGKRYDVEKGLRGAPEGSINAKKIKPEETSGLIKGETAENIAKDYGVSGRTSKILGKEYDVSQQTIHRDAKYAQAVDTVSNLTDNPVQAKNQILSGKKKLDY